MTFLIMFIPEGMVGFFFFWKGAIVAFGETGQDEL